MRYRLRLYDNGTHLWACIFIDAAKHVCVQGPRILDAELPRFRTIRSCRVLQGSGRAKSLTKVKQGYSLVRDIDVYDPFINTLYAGLSKQLTAFPELRCPRVATMPVPAMDTKQASAGWAEAAAWLRGPPDSP